MTKQEFEAAVATRVDQWLPACSGTETPFKTRNGRRLLYCFNPALDRHAYIDCDTDLVLTNEEADAALGLK